MTWTDVLEFARGPLFWVALIVFIAGMTYRLVRVLTLGFPKDRVPSNGSKTKGVLITFAKGILIWPFIPWVRGTAGRSATTYIAGGLFHLGLFVVIFLGVPHMLAWKSIVGFGWPTLPGPFVDFMAAVAIVAMLILLMNRIFNPLVRMLTRVPDWMNWTIVFVPMVTGYMMTHHLWFRYEVIFSLHMLAVDLLLIWIPMSRISHFMFYFVSRGIHGAQFAKRGVTP
jgi:nitrate reductase gamma subunit